MNTARPLLDDQFQHAGRWYRVSAIHEHGLVGTLANITGAPLQASEIVCLRIEDYAGVEQADMFAEPARRRA